ncbi:MAG: CHC2 zinc finger domain-containing protein [Acidobacteria bacterium]|nr:CHC2 zinc finger domain-containing protein [Acidobacteriota bacterium]MCI0622861.1 CHC2 zinc finger domain-containing protein [Acidobacteriota bacterium]MCI0722888.1 CHC2 zinc finger domain-containing protein [Acidobacteriota bacterium]
MRREDLEELKRQFPLLDYLQRQHWVGRQAGSKQEFVGLCPLHAETHPSFYVNASKNLFYCHGCRRGGDLTKRKPTLAAAPMAPASNGRNPFRPALHHQRDSQ